MPSYLHCYECVHCHECSLSLSLQFTVTAHVSSAATSSFTRLICDECGGGDLTGFGVTLLSSSSRYAPRVAMSTGGGDGGAGCDFSCGAADPVVSLLLLR